MRVEFVTKRPNIYLVIRNYKNGAVGRIRSGLCHCKESKTGRVKNVLMINVCFSLPVLDDPLIRYMKLDDQLEAMNVIFNVF